MPLFYSRKKAASIKGETLIKQKDRSQNESGLFCSRRLCACYIDGSWAFLALLDFKGDGIANL